MTLDYRSPGTGSHRVQHVMMRLENAHALSRAAILGKFVFGIPLCLIGPFLVATLLESIESEWHRAWLPGLLPTAMALAVIFIPLLMWLERRSRGEFLSAAMQGEGSIWRASSYGEYEMQSAKFLWLFYAEIALFGPRLLWSAIDSMRGTTELDEHRRFVAAQIVEMYDADQAIHPKELIGDSRHATEIIPVLNYLRQYEWIDMAKRRDRIWLSSSIRAKLSNVSA